MIHTASCSSSHRVGDRGTESVTEKRAQAMLMRLQKSQG